MKINTINSRFLFNTILVLLFVTASVVVEAVDITPRTTIISPDNSDKYSVDVRISKEVACGGNMRQVMISVGEQSNNVSAAGMNIQLQQNDQLILDIPAYGLTHNANGKQTIRFCAENDVIEVIQVLIIYSNTEFVLDIHSVQLKNWLTDKKNGQSSK